ncbi:MAG: pilus assembly protein [Hyphomicrobiaceae bacterium]|nr:pilus assembly protein [Hyphomicrobiaceae bacterium]
MTKFRRDERGAIAILFGLMAVVMMMFIGAAIDMSKWLSARTDTLNAVDAAVLAGARSLQTNPGQPEAAIAAAQSFYAANTRGRLQVEDTITFVTANDDTSVKAQGSAEIKTPFLGFAGIDKMPLVKVSEGEFAEAVVSVGGNSETNLELSLMLDVTGSMKGTKIADLKEAAKDLIEIVVWEDQSVYSSRVALVPFSEAVRIDSNWGAEIASNGPKTVTVGSGKGKTTFYLDEQCFVERKGTEALTDAAPNGQDKIPRFYDTDGACLPSQASIIPLSSDKVMLKEEIDGYVASGTTAGHIGTAWAWYMLSPNWEQRVPVESKPASYSMLTELNSRGMPKLRKIAVLMTDGEYNTQYCDNGVSTSYVSCTLPNGNAAAQAKKLCTNMKAKGIDVYTVGFALGGNATAIDTLKSCASNPGQFYEAENGEQLKQSFRDIALKISDLYLSK